MKGSSFDFLHHKFPKVSFQNSKAGLFDGPQIRELLNDTFFDGLSNSKEHSTWQALKCVILKLLGSRLLDLVFYFDNGLVVSI